jgi:hypothetical protein
MRTLDAAGSQAIGHDVKHSAFTHRVGSVAGRDFVKKCMRGGTCGVAHSNAAQAPH